MKGSTVFILEKNDLHLAALCMVACEAGCEVTLQTDSFNKVIQSLDRRPSLALLDESALPSPSIDAIVQVTKRSPHTRVLLISESGNLHLNLWQTLPQGVSVLTRDACRADVTYAIQTVLDGGLYLSPSLLTTLVNDGQPYARAGSPFFTQRESDVLRLMSEGLSNKEIAERLHIGPNTVKTYVSRILRKLDQPDRTRAVVQALQENLVQPAKRH